MTSKGQVSSILFFYMFNAILTSIIDLICQKISFKKFWQKIRLTITSDLTGFQQILLLSHFKKRFFVSLAMRSLFTFNVCGFLCCEGMCLILLVVHAQCTVQVQQLHKKIKHGPDAMCLMYFCLEEVVNIWSPLFSSFFLSFMLVRFFWSNFEQKRSIIHWETAACMSASDHQKNAVWRFAPLQSTHKILKRHRFLICPVSWSDVYSSGTLATRQTHTHRDNEMTARTHKETTHTHRTKEKVSGLSPLND